LAAHPSIKNKLYFPISRFAGTLEKNFHGTPIEKHCFA
jgi:hypothetical protein